MRRQGLVLELHTLASRIEDTGIHNHKALLREPRISAKRSQVKAFVVYERVRDFRPRTESKAKARAVHQLAFRLAVRAGVEGPIIEPKKPQRL